MGLIDWKLDQSNRYHSPDCFNSLDSLEWSNGSNRLDQSNRSNSPDCFDSLDRLDWWNGSNRLDQSNRFYQFDQSKLWGRVRQCQQFEQVRPAKQLRWVGLIRWIRKVNGSYKLDQVHTLITDNSTSQTHLSYKIVFRSGLHTLQFFLFDTEMTGWAFGYFSLHLLQTQKPAEPKCKIKG